MAKYYERRSGKDRRESDNGSPISVERRRTVEKRKLEILEIILSDAQVKTVFVNVFGGITACDEVANGIVKALEILGDAATKPLVVRLDGNNVEEGRAILAAAGHPLVTMVDTMDGAAAKAAELAK